MCRSREFCADTAAANQFDNFPCAQANRKNHELKKYFQKILSPRFFKSMELLNIPDTSTKRD